MNNQNPIFLTCSSLLILILSLQFLFQTCNANCTPSSCGLIPNITSRFRLKKDPINCGDRRAELSCENDVASISLNSHEYYVKEINYHDSSIRVADASIDNNNTCSFPNYSSYKRAHLYPSPYAYGEVLPINFLRCPHPLKNSSLFIEITSDCASDSRGYAYIKVGHMDASDLTEMCQVEVIVMTSWKFKDLKNVSLSEIHDSLLYGFELRFCYWCGISTKWGKYGRCISLVKFALTF